MAEPGKNELLMPSVLDRLLDDEPELTRESPRARHHALRDLKLSVRRDLENLLNTRHSYLSWPAALTELNQSLLNYGIADVTGSGLGSGNEREDFCRSLQSLLRRCEPRFKSVTVKLLTNAAPLDRTLRFRIDALLRVDPAPEPIVFDSTLEPASATFVVKGVER